MNTLCRKTLILLCALIVLFPVQSRAARLAPPVVHLKKNAAGSISISWKLARGRWGIVIAEKLLIERKKTGGGLMRFELGYPSHAGTWTDTPEADGKYIYRLRAIKGRKVSAIKTLRAKVDINIPELRPLDEGFSRCENTEMGELINAERKKAGLTELIYHPLLASAADSLSIDSRSGFGWFPPEPESYVAASGFSGDSFNQFGYFGTKPATEWIEDAMNSLCSKPKLMREDYRYMGEVCLMDEYGYPVRYILIGGPETEYNF